MKSQSQPSYQILIEGRVQGVGYRRFSQKYAQKHGISGWARNLPDGRVEIAATGSQENLEKYCEVLRQGPTFSQVREVVVKILSEDDNRIENPNDFIIRPDLELKYNNDSENR